MAKINYIGGGIIWISGFPFVSRDYSVPNLETILKELSIFLNSEEVKNYQFAFAVTANKYQGATRKILKENGFRDVVSFLSAHNNADENLTLWVKTQEDYNKNFDYTGVKIGFPPNCSVSAQIRDNQPQTSTYKYSYRCFVTFPKEGETDEELKKLSFKRIKNTPIYFKVEKEHLVKDIKDTSPKPKELELLNKENLNVAVEIIK